MGEDRVGTKGNVYVADSYEYKKSSEWKVEVINTFLEDGWSSLMKRADVMLARGGRPDGVGAERAVDARCDDCFGLRGGPGARPCTIRARRRLRLPSARARESRGGLASRPDYEAAESTEHLEERRRRRRRGEARRGVRPCARPCAVRPNKNILVLRSEFLEKGRQMKKISLFPRQRFCEALSAQFSLQFCRLPSRSSTLQLLKHHVHRQV